MPRELEIIGAAAATGLVAGGGAGRPAGDTCANCGAPLVGVFCAQCGQSADDHHRSIVHLAWEAFEGLTHLDGRIARTLPLLLFNPGRLARDHFEGRRARHIPPFRLFLVTLLAFMLVLEGAVETGGMKLGQAMSTRSAARDAVTANALNKAHAASIEDVKATILSSAGRSHDAGEFLRSHLKRALDNPEYYKSIVFTWAHRLAFLVLPINALFLSLLYIYRRKFYIYDHLVTSMIFLSFVFLLSAVAFLLPEPVQSWAVGLAFLWIPVNLFATLRGAYGSGIVGAVVETGLLSLATLIVFFSLLLILLVVGLTQI